MVINEEGRKLGTMPVGEALKLAFEKELDLVEVSPQTTPPVCKIMDYGKYLYRIAKQKRLQSTKQKKIETKTIRLSIRTEKHDLEFKAKNAVKFMKKGNKVRINMVLKGRERALADFASKKLDSFLKIISDISKADPETEQKEVVKEQDIKKIPQGFSVVIGYK